MDDHFFRFSIYDMDSGERLMDVTNKKKTNFNTEIIGLLFKDKTR